MKTAVIMNGLVASTQRAVPVREAAARFGARLEITNQQDDAAQQARKLVELGVTRIVIAGGDGTIHEVVQGLAPDFPPIELGVIPLGTGNDLARSLGLNLYDLSTAAEHAFTCDTVPIDVVAVENSQILYFVNAASGGFGGSVTVDVTSAAKQTWGAFAYWFTALGKFSQLPEYQVAVTAEDSHFQGSVVGIGLSKGRFVGGGFPLAADSYLNDGRLTITVVPTASALELMGVAVDLALGRPWDAGKIQVFRSATVQMNSSPSMPFSLDGEPERSSLHTFRVLPYKLRVGFGMSAALKPE